MLPFWTAPQRAAAFSGPAFGYAELDIPEQAAACLQAVQPANPTPAQSASMIHTATLGNIEVAGLLDVCGVLRQHHTRTRNCHLDQSTTRQRGPRASVPRSLCHPHLSFYHECISQAGHFRRIQPTSTAVNIIVGHNHARFSNRSGRVSSQVTHSHVDQTVQLREYFDVHSWPTALVGFCSPLELIDWALRGFMAVPMRGHTGYLAASRPSSSLPPHTAELFGLQGVSATRRNASVGLASPSHHIEHVKANDIDC